MDERETKILRRRIAEPFLEPYRLVIRVAGRVDTLKPGQSDWMPLWRSRILCDGDAVRTHANSKAIIRLADRTEVEIGPHQVVPIDDVRLTPDGRSVVFTETLYRLRKRVLDVLGRQQRFEVTAPGALSPRG